MNQKVKLISVNGNASPLAIPHPGSVLEFQSLVVEPPKPPETGWSIWDASRPSVQVSRGEFIRDAMAALVDGSDLLLEAGGVWGESLILEGLIDVRLGMFGEGIRPLLKPPEGKPGIRLKDCSDLTISDLEIAGPSDVFADRSAGITSTKSLRNIRFENVYIHDMALGVSIQSRDMANVVVENIEIHRCVLADNFVARLDPFTGDVSTPHSQGCFFKGIAGMDITECVVTGNGHQPGFGRSPLNHGLYIQYDCQNVRVLESIIGDNATNGVMQRPAGSCQNNFIWRQPTAITFGNVKDPEKRLHSGICSHNTVVNGVNGDPERGYVWAINLKQLDNFTCHNNLDANASDHPDNLRAFQLAGILRNGNLNTNVVADWGVPLKVQASDTTGSTFEAPGVVHKLDVQLPPNLDAELRAMERGNWTHSAASLSQPWRDAAGIE